MMNLFEMGSMLARATESVARAIVPLSGKGKKDDADHVAVETMRSVLDSLDLDLHIHLGEGEKDNAPMLYKGERLGRLSSQQREASMDLVVDPLECTTNFSKGLPDSTSVIVAAPAGSIKEIPGSYMEQILVSPMASGCLERDSLDLDSSPAEMIASISTAIGCPPKELNVVIQDRPRHKDLIDQVRRTGAGVSLIESGSISAAMEILINLGGRAQILWGKFGAPEGLVLAAAANLAGTTFLGRIAPHTDAMRRHAEELGILGKTFTGTEWVSRSTTLVVSGVHSSPWLRGVERLYLNGSSRYKTHTLVWAPEKRAELVHTNGEFTEELTR